MRHDHDFLGPHHRRNERRTRLVIGLTAAMMAGEIAAGVVFGSMALLADGFHMATHAGALTIAALAYLFARRHARDPRFAFGTGKVGELAGFASAIVLGVVALLIGFESLMRLGDPRPIRFDEAIAVAALGLAVNLTSAWLLHDKGHRHDHDHHAGGRHADHNLRAAYLHVLADALTSVLAIVGLLAGRFYGWAWMDPMMGIVGAAVIARWSAGLLRGAGLVLLDMTPDAETARAMARRLERDGDEVTDLHLWRVGPGHVAAIVSVAAARPEPPEVYRARLAEVASLSHPTVEVNPRRESRAS